MKTAKISEVIKMLKDVKNSFGDVNVYLSVDEEGNCFGTIDKNHSLGWDEEAKFVVIYP